MKYDILIINSGCLEDYTEHVCDGVKLKNIDKKLLDELVEISLKQNYTVVIQKYEEEE